MRKITFYNTYKKDYKLIAKQISNGKWNEDKIDEVISILQLENILPAYLKDHTLTGNYKDFRECHIYSDLIIIYKRNDTELHLYRIGRHQDLFKDY